ncbi:MAG: DNA translocase FtsK 4TM domain-containing protein, partial [Phycisphaerae bacterium]
MSLEPHRSRLETLRTCGLLAGLAACTFAWISLLTFDVFDWPSTLAWPTNDPPHNGCGRVGAWAAYQAIHYFGLGSYVLLVMLSGGAVARLLRGELGDAPLRLTGSILMTAAGCGLATLALGGPQGDRLMDAGGVLGMAVVQLLQPYLSLGGTALLLIATLAIGVLLAADELVLKAPSAVRWVGAQSRLALSYAGAANTAHGRSNRAARTTAAGRGVALAESMKRLMARVGSGLGQAIRSAGADPETAEPARERRADAEDRHDPDGSSPLQDDAPAAEQKSQEPVAADKKASRRRSKAEFEEPDIDESVDSEPETRAAASTDSTEDDSTQTTNAQQSPRSVRDLIVRNLCL